MFEVKPIKNLDGNRTEVAISRSIGSKKNVITRNFSVQKDKVDEFVADYKKLQRRSSIAASVSGILAAGLGGVVGGKIYNKFFIGPIMVGLAFFSGAMALVGRTAIKKDKEIMDKHGVQELFYLKNEDANSINKVVKS